MVTHEVVNSISPEIGHGRIARLSKGWLIIKTHHWILTRVIGATCVFTIREPFDTVASYFEYRKRLGLNSEEESFRMFWRSKNGMSRYIEYLSFLSQNKNDPRFILLKYSDMLEGSERYFHDLLLRLNINSRISVEKIYTLTSRAVSVSLERSSQDSSLSDFSTKKNYSVYAGDLDESDLKSLRKAERLYESL